METITSNEINQMNSAYGPLLSHQVLAIPEKPGALALEFHTGSGELVHMRHIVLTDAQQLLEMASEIRRTLLPRLDAEILAVLERVERKL